MECINRQEALELLKKYNKEPFHIQHGLRCNEMVCSKPWLWQRG